MAASPTSSSHFSDYTYNERDNDVASVHFFPPDLTEQMRVPKRIKGTGEHSDDHSENALHWHQHHHPKMDMTVPDRIIVTGRDQHIGTRSAPREIIMDNSLGPMVEPGYMRVSTPPRVITLADHHFPPLDTHHHDGDVDDYEDDEHFQLELNHHSPNDFGNGCDPNQGSLPSSQLTGLHSNASQLIIQSSTRDATPLSENENTEVSSLWKEVYNLQRRVLAIELDNIQMRQRDKIIYAIGFVYFLVKTVSWLNRH